MTDKNGDIVFQPHRHHWVEGEQDDDDFVYLQLRADRGVLLLGCLWERVNAYVRP